ncbi:glycosyltransferase family 4 protein [Liquorilactobacillus vini]|uniref:Glycosyltransferase n=1 Tax=Liquorilactobacillus vini DSM 20605 TaxID=1133569 RepID=A0A0A7RME6_9LACO|nr:glycosyltransferase family 4 protein [Liquorilactobacillus vini]AJA34448.1 glycosyltransferase [Liquorilactobacillus vini DSM 20605]KRM84413.1 hypothetical protein FD21_GL001987 [Liquorilactobacillus vini DSM 20605]
MKLTRQQLNASLKSIDTLVKFLEKYNFQEILQTVAEFLAVSPQNLLNGLGEDDKEEVIVKNYSANLKDLISHAGYFRELYDLLTDEYSKKVLLNLLSFRILPVKKLLSEIIGHEQFLLTRLVKCSRNKALVVCGSGNGILLKYHHDYQPGYVFESSIEKLVKDQQKLTRFSNLKIKLLNNSQENNLNRTVVLDSEVKEPIGLLQVDTPKSSIGILISAKNHLQKDHPKIIVYLSHAASHLWKIPMLLKQICPNYKFYLRYYQKDHASKLVLFAVPKEKISKLALNKKLHFYSFNGTSGKWRDGELTKEVGVIPYLLLKQYGIQQTLVTKNDSSITYNNLKKVVPGLKIEYSPDNDNFIISELEFVQQNYRQMDGLILRGPYPSFFPVLDLYRQLRPDGYVYLYLDANAAWMDRINWQDRHFQKFMDQCDLIATSGRMLQKHLNIKWPKWTINYIPNGFYNFSHHNLDLKWDKKEKVILTVGRIGTYQKNNEALLLAFSQIAEKIPEWSVKLVGPVEDQFKSWLEKYFACYPKLKGRVILVGEIVDKGKLLTEYQRASIFVLTSRLEGGTPNVIAEALTGGDCIITSGIAEAADATNNEKCGRIYHSNAELAQLLVELSTNASLRLKLEKAAWIYSQANFAFEKIIKRLHALLFWREDQ